MISLDTVFESTSQLGRYQLFCLLLLCIPGAIMDTYYTFDAVFLLFEPAHRCKLFPSETVGSVVNQTNALAFEVSANSTAHRGLAVDPQNHSALTLHAHACSITVFEAGSSNITDTTAEYSECKYGYLYDNADFDETVVTRWDLVCKNDIYPKIGLSVRSLTPVLLSCVIAFLQDRFGRRVGYLVCVGIYLASNLLSLFSPSPVVFFTLLALAPGSPWSTCYVWALELVGPSKRTLASAIMCIAYTCGAMSVGLIAYLCRTWKQIILATTLPFVPALAFFWLIPESPRWLLGKGSMDKAHSCLLRLMCWQPNVSEIRTKLFELFQTPEKGKPPQGGVKRSSSFGIRRTVTTISFADYALDNYEAGISDLAQEEAASAAPQAVESFWQDFKGLFTKPNLRRKTILVTFAAMISSLSCNTIAYNLENMPGSNMYLTFVIQASMELPAAILNLLTLNRFGRIRPTTLWLTIGGVACLLAAQTETWPFQLTLAFTVLAKLGSTAASGAIYQMETEYYPTCVRNSGMTFTSSMTLIASAAMPYIVYSGRLSRAIPMTILGCLSIVAAVAVLCLPETADLKQMPQTISDGDRIGKVGVDTIIGNVGLKRLRVYAVDGVATKKAVAFN